MWQGWVNFIVGLWLILSGIIGSLGVSVNYIIAGIIVAVLGFIAAKQWQGIVDGILGLWLILSGILGSLMASANLFIVGIVVAVLSIWMATTGKEEPATIG